MIKPQLIEVKSYKRVYEEKYQKKTCERISFGIKSGRHRATANWYNSYITIGYSDSNETNCDEFFSKIP